MIFTLRTKIICSSVLGLLLTGCASTPMEQGPSMDSVWSRGLDSDKTTVELLQSGLTANPMLAGAEAGYPIVIAPTVLPIWEPGDKISEFIKTDGRWIYEIVDPGGFID